MDKTVKFKVEFEINGQKVLRDVTVDANELQGVVGKLKKEAEGLGDVLKDVQKEVKGLTSEFERFTQTTMMLDSLASYIAASRLSCLVVVTHITSVFLLHFSVKVPLSS
jgi:hypothetical protein